MNGYYMQYGCGTCAPAGWLNFDASPTLRFERLPLVGRLYTRNAVRFPANVRYGDIVRGLPIPPKSCAGIYCSHVLEHLSYEDCLAALRNTYRYLQPGGVFRCVVPDLASQVRAYLQDPSAEAASRFMEYTGLGRKSRPRSPSSHLASLLSNSQHLWMWDVRSLTKVLLEVGFAGVRQVSCGDCADARFSEVEHPDRFVDAVALECQKPEKA